MNRFKKILSMTVAGLFLASSVFGATKLHKDLTGADLHVCKVHASTTHIQGGTDPLTNSTAEGMTGLTAFTQGDLLYYNSGTALSKLGKDATATRYLSNTGTNNNPAWAQIALGTGVSGTLPIANGGTNASSFAQSNGLLYYNGTALVADTAALTSTYLPLAGANGRLGNSVITQNAAGDVEWTTGNVIQVPVAAGTALQTACTAASVNDVLELGAGTYALTTNSLTPGKALTIRGKGVDATTISFTTGVLTYNAANIKFENLTLSFAPTGAEVNCIGNVTDALSGMDLTNVKISVSHGTGTTAVCALYSTYPIGGTWKNVVISGTSSSASIRGYLFELSGNTCTSQTLNIYNSHVSVSTTGTGKSSNAIIGYGDSVSGVQTINQYGGSAISSETGANDGNGVYMRSGAGAVYNGYGVYISGTEYDVHQLTSGVLTLSNCSLANNTTSGTITYAGTVATKNIGLGTVAVGTSGTNVAILGTGTAPTTSPADAFQMYSADVGGVAGQAGAHIRSELGGVAAINSALGTLNTYTYQKDDLADDGTVTLPDATSGMVIVTCNAESGLFHVQTDGTVTKIAGSTNTAATDSDGNLCVYDGGTGGIVKNRLAATGEIRIVYYYN